MNHEAKDGSGKEDRDSETAAQPDASADRGAPPSAARSGHAPREPRTPPLPIKEIEELEDDAPGG
jgi:hypothetical protein